MELGVLQVEVGLDQEDLHVLPLHLLDQLERVARRRRDARLRLDVPDDVQAEALAEVRPGAMVRDDLEALVRRHRRVPALLAPRPGACRSRRSAPGSSAASAGRSSDELRRIGLGDAPAVVRIQPVVRVAEGMDVAHGAGHLARRDVEDLGRRGGVEVAVGAGLDLRVAALLDERREPADLELAPDHDEQVGLRELQDEAGLGLDEVGILVAAADEVHGRMVSRRPRV